jgi:DNA-binding SARP family transcriptional activator
MVGELPRARALILDALPKVSADDRSGRASAVYALGYVREACGEWLEAAAAYEQCVRLCEQIGNLGLRTAAVVGLMGTYESTGDRERSDQIWVELLAYLQDPTLQSHHCSPIYLVRATVLAHRHDWEGVIYIVSENFAPIAHSCSPRDRFAFDILAVRAELGCMTGNLQSESQRNVPPDLLAGWVARLDAIEPYFRRERLLDHLIDIDRTRLHLALAGWEATPREELLSEILQFLTAMGAPARLAEVVDEFTGTAIAELPLFKHAFVPARSRPKPRFDAQVQDAAVPQVPAEDSEALRIFTFGKLRVIPPHHTAPLTRADWQGSRKARLLLAYLLATDLKSRGVSRDQIFEAVWSEAENWDLTNSFQIALNRLRRALRSDDSESATKYVVYNDDTYRLVEAGVWCDARVFDRHLDAADALERQGRAKDAIRSRRAAFELYDGPFLGDFEENWAQSRQEDYCKRFAKVGITLAESAFASGKLDEVEQIAERMITANSQGEDGHRLLIRVYHKTGRHQDALRQFKRCRDIFTEMPPVNAIADLEAWLDQSTGDFDTRPESRRDPRRRSS